jgi:hypothetical protein
LSSFRSNTNSRSVGARSTATPFAPPPSIPIVLCLSFYYRIIYFCGSLAFLTTALLYLVTGNGECHK